MNIAEILKYCPKGTKLYSPIYGNVILDSVLPENSKFPIIIKDGAAYQHVVTEQGYYAYDIPNLECVLFPSKDQRDWNKFRLPVKKGDIMMEVNGKCPFISSGKIFSFFSRGICGLTVSDCFKIGDVDGYWTDKFYIPASEEVKKKLFDKMAEAGYRWNTNTLKLEKIELKFKEGDVILNRDGDICLVSEILSTKVQVIAILFTNNYLSTPTHSRYRNIDEITLASNDNRNKLFSALVREGYKYDKEQHKLIKQEFKPFDKVLVRDKDTDPWKTDIYLNYEGENRHFCYKCTRMNYAFCIPYEGNEYLLGTIDSPT